MNPLDKLKSENLSAGRKFTVEDIPVKKFYDQAQYIESVLMPAIKRKSGEDHPDYIYFREVYKSLLYAVMLADRNREIVLKAQQLLQLNKILQVRVDIAERELLKYTTVEDLYFTEALDHIAAGVKNRVEDILNKK